MKRRLPAWHTMKLKKHAVEREIPSERSTIFHESVSDLMAPGVAIHGVYANVSTINDIAEIWRKFAWMISSSPP